MQAFPAHLKGKTTAIDPVAIIVGAAKFDVPGGSLGR